MSLPQVSCGDCPLSAVALTCQCHPRQFPSLPFRRSNVSSGAVHPTWAPFRSTLAAEERLRFSLRLMDGGCSPGGFVSLCSPFLMAPGGPNGAKSIRVRGLPHI